MAKTAVRLTSQLNVTNTAESSLCTPATGSRFELKHIQATNTDPATTMYLCIALGADVAANRIVDQASIAANSEYARFVMHNVEAATIVCASASVNAKVNLTLNGYLHTSL